jgi:hypothetical protein
MTFLDIGKPRRLGYSMSTTALKPRAQFLQIGGIKEDQKIDLVEPWMMNGSMKSDPIVIMLIGRRGRGKTQGMTWMGGFQKQAFKELGSKNQIASNYWTSYSHRLDPNLINWLNTDGMFDPAARNLYCLVDEVGSQFANRRSMAQANVDFSQVLTQIRKLNTEMVFTTQFPQWVDMMVLFQVDLFIMMDGYNRTVEGVPNTIDMYVFDYWGQWTGDMRRKHWPPQMDDVDWQFTIHEAAFIKDQYRTNQIVPPAWYKKKDQVVKSMWGEEYVEADDPMLGITPEAAAFMSQGAPQTVEGILEAFGNDPFAIKSVKHRLQRVDNTLSNMSVLHERLQKLGYSIENGWASK